MPSPATLAVYRKIYGRLAFDAPPAGGAELGAAIADRLAGITLAKATRVTYQASVRYHLESDYPALTEFERVYAGLSKSEALKKSKPRRRIEDRVFALVVEMLEENAVNWSRALATRWMVLGVRYFGLRPSEWEKAEWLSERKNVLRVKNGKYADGEIERGPMKGSPFLRANGEYREIILGPSSATLLREIADGAIEATREFPYSNPVFGDAYRRTHRWAVQRLVSSRKLSKSYLKTLTIYDYRHSFSSDAKGTLSVADGEVAALMGHRKTSTAVWSYARKGPASSALGVIPTKGSVSRVAIRDALEPTPEAFDVIEPIKPDTPDPSIKRGPSI